MKVSVSIDVPDLAQAEAFYVGALGCEKLRDQAGMSVISAGNCEIYLQRKEAGTKPTLAGESRRYYRRHWTPVHLDFLAENVDEIVVRIIELGGVHEGGKSGDWGSIAYCADPFGNGFCVINE